LNEPKQIDSILTLQSGWLDNSPPNSITLGTTGSIVYAGGSLITALPVEMTYFTVTVRNTNTLLRWSTATETNNAGFQVERKHEASDNWVIVVFINGAGTSNIPQSYAYEDKDLERGHTSTA